jgi:hypothetical protein
MRRTLILAMLALAVAGCSWFRPEPPVQTITPGSRIIYNGGTAVWVVCDRGNLVYFSQGTAAINVVAGGCPTGVP